jgi:hypothetical protein
MRLPLRSNYGFSIPNRVNKPQAKTQNLPAAVSFAADGTMLVATGLPEREKYQLGLDQPARLRWMAEQHQPYLAYHRARFGGG